MDSEKEEMNQTDIAALHHFYSRHISNLPDDQALTELFAQVHDRIAQTQTIFRVMWILHGTKWYLELTEMPYEILSLWKSVARNLLTKNLLFLEASGIFCHHKIDQKRFQGLWHRGLVWTASQNQIFANPHCIQIDFSKSEQQINLTSKPDMEVC